MSRFRTTIPIDFKPFMDALPSRTHIHSTEYVKDKREIVIIWENEGMNTGLSVATDFTLEALQALQARKAVQGTDDLGKTPIPPAPVLRETPKPNAPPVAPGVSAFRPNSTIKPPELKTPATPKNQPSQKARQRAAEAKAKPPVEKVVDDQPPKE